MAAPEVIYCEKCHKTMKKDEFYMSNNLEKYPTGFLNQCKKCIAMFVDIWDSSTYLWILEECDVPYIPDVWNSLMAKFAKDAANLTPTSILGRYLGMMRLKRYKDYRYKDTDFIAKLEQSKQEQALAAQGFSPAEIAEKMAAVEKAEPPPRPKAAAPQDDPYRNQYDESLLEEEAMGNKLTDDDIIKLRLKWGKAYKPEEWIALEKMYEEMMASYDIQGAGHIDTLKMLCKTSLKANQLIDLGDVDGFQKMMKVYNDLSKSGNFTAAQIKENSGDFVDSISELVAVCEKEGFIPRYYTDGPQDKVDKVLLDLQNYTRNLVSSETNLEGMLDAAMTQIAQDRANEAKQDIDDDDEFDNDLFDENKDVLNIKDYQEFTEKENYLQNIDDEYFAKLVSGEGDS